MYGNNEYTSLDCSFVKVPRAPTGAVSTSNGQHLCPPTSSVTRVVNGPLWQSSRYSSAAREYNPGIPNLGIPGSRPLSGPENPGIVLGLSRDF
ncbi:hypothetical protein EVAR_37586_1 [Eumeta japonica]|uniref:Uncharacterized protein n=1 Tax=Eumeta variegata TaxID=151549 RepID=A0A4C1VQU6_EUMVA|nr:hypothetical protein EVAR_37586_1 [Eumeta japonica]